MGETLEKMWWCDHGNCSAFVREVFQDAEIHPPAGWAVIVFTGLASRVGETIILCPKHRDSFNRWRATK